MTLTFVHRLGNQPHREMSFPMLLWQALWLPRGMARAGFFLGAPLLERWRP